MLIFHGPKNASLIRFKLLGQNYIATGWKKGVCNSDLSHRHSPLPMNSTANTVINIVCYIYTPAQLVGNDATTNRILQKSALPFATIITNQTDLADVSSTVDSLILGGARVRCE